MSTARRPLGTGPVPASDRPSRNDAAPRPTVAERLAATVERGEARQPPAAGTGRRRLGTR